ncbi:MAG: Rrf2 family transcriptional regulator [Planctomycetota bacterium]
MILNQTAVYALRAAAALAALPPGMSIRAQELAERTHVPVHYLSKVMRRLVLAGLVTSRKGHGGGFALSRPPKQVTFAELLAATDAAPEPGKCAYGWGSCDPDDPCPLHPTWSSLQEMVGAWSTSCTLDDVDADALPP